MDDVIFLISLVGVLGGTVALWFIAHRWRRGWERTLRRAAYRLRGSVPVTDDFEIRTLQFSIEGHSATIDFTQGAEPYTRIKVAMLRRSPGVFRVLPSDAAREQMKFIGAKDIRIGDPRFDAAWFVTSRPENLAHRIFSDERRSDVIASVRRLSRYPRPSIEITRDTLRVSVAQWLGGEDDILALAQTAIDFVGYLLRLGPEEGIAWVAAGDSDPGLCPVCAASLAEDVVQCDKCRTPHHEECWIYVGQCSTYACKGKRFVA
jgi:hypothetical protein